ncbi:MAG: PPC domain-containing protein [Kofleriaceae bacterium]
MRTLSLVFLASLAAAACGGGGDDTPATPDAAVTIDAAIDSPMAGACSAPIETVTTYPATIAGDTTGAGNHSMVAEAACADTRGDFGSASDDQSIHLTNLVAGKTYLLELTTTADLSMYVATTCDAAGPAAGACLLHVDATTANERGEFVAPASGTVEVIIDGYQAGEAGAYSLAVTQAECTMDAECGGATPLCVDFACAQCGSSFDCTTPGAPVCDATGTCVAGGGTCTGDTVGENDNGPAAARPLAYPTAGMPATSMAAVCGTPNGNDWYKVVAPGMGAVSVAVTWTATADLDFAVLDATGASVGSGLSTNPNDESKLITFPAAGTYYIRVVQYVPGSGTPSDMLVPYTITLALPECTTSFDCTNAATPICNPSGTCVAGPDACTGDVGEPDDGPAAAHDLTGAIGTPTSFTAAVCSSPSAEYDWYRVTTTAAGEGIVWSLAAAGADDLDIAVFDSSGAVVGISFWKVPEVVTLTYLPAGTYYARVQLFTQNPQAAAVGYTMTATRTAAQTCTAATDCAQTYSTQLFRGACTAGACQFIAPGTRASGAACDSGNDCMSGSCSYSAFESDAAESVCTISCATSADCAPLGAGFACTTGFQTNVCMPTCANNLECGADTNGTPAAGDTWLYFTCTSGSCGA